MDPENTARLIIAALLDGDPDALRRHSEDLADWIDAGGFMPELSNVLEIKWGD
jgi:hypothetical protein